MDGQSILIIILVGIIAGWIAGKVVRGAGFGLIGDLIVGIVGAFIGGWLLPRLGIGTIVHNAILDSIIVAAIGAIILLLVLRLIRR
jgi:uncharacterized membrane protein YeaQ/YmgE (transglycosylase-associated protein family)